MATKFIDGQWVEDNGLNITGNPAGNTFGGIQPLNQPLANNPYGIVLPGPTPIQTGLIKGNNPLMGTPGVPFIQPKVNAGTNTPVVQPTTTGRTGQFGPNGMYTYNLDAQGNPTGSPIATASAPIVTPPAPVAPPGSFNSLYQAPVDPYQAETDSANAILNNTNQITDPNEIYANTLKAYQAQIDAINNVYNDQLNQSRTQNAAMYEGRVGSQTAMAARAGLLGSDPGKAMVDNQVNANKSQQMGIEQALDTKRRQDIAAVYGEVQKASATELAANKLAKTKGAEAILANIETKKATRASNLSKAVKALVAKGIDANTMTPEEIKSFTDGLGITKDELLTALDSAAMDYNKSIAEQEKLDAEATERKLKNEKLEKETALLGQMTEKDKARLAFDKQKLGEEMAIRKWEKIYGVENKEQTGVEVKQIVNKAIAAAIADGSWDEGTDEQHENFIRSLGGTPSDYEI